MVSFLRRDTAVDLWTGAQQVSISTVVQAVRWPRGLLLSELLIFKPRFGHLLYDNRHEKKIEIFANRRAVGLFGDDGSNDSAGHRVCRG